MTPDIFLANRNKNMGHKPTIKIVELSEDSIRFLLTNCDVSLANALRRAIIAEVPTMAIDMVTIETNSSNQQAEFLAHRLGLIPLRSMYKKKSFQDFFVDTSECHCQEECLKCTARFQCFVTASEKSPRVVTTDDIIPEMGWENQAVLPVSYPIDGVETPISFLTLEKGQSIKFRASAKLGIGKNHAKWSPVSIATYQMTENENEFDFRVETLGGITPVDILKTAIQVLKSKVQTLL